MKSRTLVLLLTSVAASNGAAVDLIDVMLAGASSTGCKEGPPCKYEAFRIPGLIACGNGTLLAFAEGRKFGCGDFGSHTHKNGGQHDLVMSKSTDGGRTWGGLRTLVDALTLWPNISAATPPENGNAVWDPTPVHDYSTSTTFLFFNGPGREACDVTGLCQTWVLTSTNFGETWAAAKNVTEQCQRTGVATGRFAGNTPGNGRGVQLSTGRLVVPMYAGTPGGASICYSDDHGSSWHSSTQALGGMAATEIEVAELEPRFGSYVVTRCLEQK